MDREAVPEGTGLRLRFLLPLAAIAVLAALPAGANATVLYDSGQAGPEPDGTQVEVSKNTRVAQQFTPTTTGTARYVWFSAFAYCCAGSHIPEGPAPFTLRIQENNSTTNLPGRLLTAVAGIVSDDGGVGVGGCLELEEETTLSASQSYWVVLESGDKRFFWNPGASGGGQVRRSTNAGATWQTPNSNPPEHGPNPNTLSLWVSDKGCDPHAVTNPAPSTTLGDMYIKSGQSTFNSITVSNDGNGQLSITGHSITGPDASSFRVLNNDPNGVPPGGPISYPRTLGPGGGPLFFYPTCDGSGAEGTREATLTISTNDPTQRTISWDLFCIIDNTPPTVTVTHTPDGRSGWHTKNPAPFRAQGLDPPPGLGVKRIYCEDGDGGETWLYDSGSVKDFTVLGEGFHSIYCEGTDAANNTSTMSFMKVVAIDSVPPNTEYFGPTGGPEPPELTTETSREFSFGVSDATSGVQEIECKLDSGPWTACTSPVTRTGLSDGPHTFMARGRDIAGNLETTPKTWTWRVDTTPPNTTLTGGPKPFTSALTAAFVHRGTDAVAGVASVECSLDGAAFALCPEQLTYAGLAEGPHVVRARAIDKLGHIDPTPAVRKWTIDLTTPVVSNLKARKVFLIYKSSEAAAATILIERFDSAKRKFVREKKYTRRAVEGRNKLRLPKRLEAGRYRVTITTVDRAGHKSKPKRLRFRR